MRNLVLLAVLALPPFTLAGCGDQSPSDASAMDAQFRLAAAQPAPELPDVQRTFVAVLSGDNEVPPVDTKAVGQAKFSLSADGLALHYRLIVANIEDVSVSHIHLAPAGVNGGVVVFLFAGPAPGAQNGVLAEGTITAAELINDLAGHPLSDLIEQMKSGGAYVNVHTTVNGGGEIRGQIDKPAGGTQVD